MAIPPVTLGMGLVFGLVLLALVLFVTELVPNDTTALIVVVSVVVLEPWTGMSAQAAISGFSSPATVTIVAMYMLSAGVQKTGVVQLLGAHIARFTRGDETRLLGAIVGTTGPVAGIINNTPVVAVFVPMISDLADESGISRSKLLLPLSYAAMLGGTLTLVGTATNILVSDVAAQLSGEYPTLHPIGMFEFTPLGVVVLVVGLAYLMTVGRWLTPERLPPAVDLTESFGVEDNLVMATVREGSLLVGSTVESATVGLDLDVDVLQFERDGDVYVGPETDQEIAAGDVLTLRGGEADLEQFVAQGRLRRHWTDVDEDDLLHPEGEGGVAEAVVTPDSGFVGETVAEAKFGERYDSTLIAARRGEQRVVDDLDAVVLEAGDTLLLQTTPEALAFLAETGDLLVTDEPDFPVEPAPPAADVMSSADPAATGGTPTPVGGRPPGDADEAPVDHAGRPVDLHPQTGLALAILAGVVAVAGLGLLPIVVAALAGVVAMTVSGLLAPSEAYDAVSWNVIFLLAGVIPLGLALQRTGGDALVAALLVGAGAVLPALAVLGLFYLLTGLLANVITPVASAVLLAPIAAETAARIGSEPFSFLLAVLFGASSAFTTPVGYQTNLMVYGPGGYRFTDYVRVGGPLQLLLAVVTTLGIAVLWGV